MTDTTRYFDVIRRPVITEKSNRVIGDNAYVFEVEMSANKALIRQAIESVFKVKVTAVNTVITRGKTTRHRGRAGRRRDVKKAYVTLQAGDEIDVNTGL